MLVHDMTSGCSRFAALLGTRRWVVAVTVLGSGIAALDATVVSIAPPAIGREFRAGVGAPAVDGKRLHPDPFPGRAAQVL